MLRSLTVAVLITVCGGLAIAQTDVSGSWTLTIDAGQGGANDTPMMLEQDGDRLTGTYGAADAESPIEGTDSDITFTSEIDAPQVGPMTLSFTGTVDGSSMKGSVDFGGFIQGSWTAVKN